MSANRRGIFALAAIFIAAGVMHFVIPLWFDRIVPTWIPDARMATLLSGVAEIAGGVGLLIPATRRAAGWGLFALLLAVFPANVNMLQLARAAHESPGYIAALWVRLPLQPLLMWWVWRAAISHSAHTRTD